MFEADGTGETDHSPREHPNAGITGLELLAKICERRAWRNISAIAITAYAMPGDQERITAAGFDDYIAKPLTVMNLVDESQALIAAKSEVE